MKGRFHGSRNGAAEVRGMFGNLPTMTPPESLDERTIMLFQLEIRRQAIYARIAIGDMRSALPDPDQKMRFWYSVDAALGALARLGDILWPKRTHNGAGARADQLRAHFAIEDLPVLQAKETRNSFEHFAERIDAWSRESVSQDFADTSFGDPRMMGLDGGDIARTYHQDRDAIEVFGSEISLAEATQAINKIMRLVPDPHEVLLRANGVEPEP
ncbi:MAG: hypothetical protein ABWY12_08195 [Burkholderiales bacterium]